MANGPAAEQADTELAASRARLIGAAGRAADALAELRAAASEHNAAAGRLPALDPDGVSRWLASRTPATPPAADPALRAELAALPAPARRRARPAWTPADVSGEPPLIPLSPADRARLLKSRQPTYVTVRLDR